MKLRNTLLALTSAALAAVSPAIAAGSSSDGHHHHGATAMGEAGQTSQVTRTVQVEMRDNMQFVPSKLQVKQGETLRIVVKNAGQLTHEIVLGSEKDLKAHAELMKKFPEMEHAEPNMLTLAAGKTGALVWKFSKAGVVNFACLQPGHFDAGMKGQLQVSPVKAAAKVANKEDIHAH
ncbi:MAG: cupredoxin family protein [Rhodoferax sp.]|nr:cupredoxin family protein [Rhodoferax sp.]